MPDHCNDLVVGKLLCDLRRGARVARVILRIEFERDLVAADDKTVRVNLLNREPCAVFLILAGVRATTGQRRGEANAHDLVGESARHMRRQERRCDGDAKGMKFCRFHDVSFKW
jgi:hypothetical protein